MALFAVISDDFIFKILRKAATDYNLEFYELKSRYCGPREKSALCIQRAVRKHLKKLKWHRIG